MLPKNVLGITSREKRIFAVFVTLVLCGTIISAFAISGDVSLGGATSTFEGAVRATNLDSTQPIGDYSYMIYPDPNFAVNELYNAKAANGTICWISTNTSDVARQVYATSPISVVFIGDFGVNNAIQVSDGSTTDLTNARFILATNANCNVFENLNKVAGGNFTIIGGYIDGNYAGQSTAGMSCGLQIFNATKITIQGGYYTGCTNYGISFRSVNDSVVNGVTFEECSGDDDFELENNSANTSITRGSQRNAISNCISINKPNRLVGRTYSSFEVGTDAESNTFTNCHVLNTVYSIDGSTNVNGFSTHSAYGTINNTLLIGCTVTGAPNAGFNFLDATISGGVKATTHMVGCATDGCYYGVSIGSVSAGVLAEGCTISNSFKDGVIFNYNSSISQFFHLKGVDVVNATSTAYNFGGQTPNGTSRTLLESCSASRSFRGIMTALGNLTVSGGAYFNNVNNGMSLLAGTKYVTVHGAVFWGNTGQSDIRLWGYEGNSTSFVNNEFLSATPIYGNVTGVNFIDNINYSNSS